MKMRSALLVVVALAVSVALVGCGMMETKQDLPKTAYDTATQLKAQKKYTEAVAAYQQFIAANEFPALNGYAQYHIGLCYLEMGDKVRAAAEFKKAVDTYPKHEAAAWCHEELKRLQAKPAAPAAPAAPAPAAPKK